MVSQRHAAFAEESAEVEVLYASLATLKSVTKKMASSQNRLNDTGRMVQEAIGPMYSNTQRLQTQNANIERILAAIEKVQQPMELRSKEERIIKSRPDRVGLNEYIASIDRTKQALKELKATNLRSNQAAIAELSGLLGQGISNLESVFRDLVHADSAPIEPLKQITQAADFPRLAPDKSAQLRTINANIAGLTAAAAPSPRSGEPTASAKVYAHERGQYLALSLQNLSTASISTARKVSADAVYKPGSCAIGTYASGIQGMFIAEYDSICPVFSREEWGPVLSATCQDSLRTFASTLRDLDAHVKSHLVTDCFLAYEIIDVVAKTSFQIENRTGELKQALSDALKPVRETAKSSLAALLNDTRAKVSQVMQLSPDGAALPVTTEVMTRLQLMTAYLTPLSSIMRSLGDGGWSAAAAGSAGGNPGANKAFDVGADGKQLFAHYSSDTIDALMSSLESKGRALLKGKSAQGVFVANNIAVVERMIRSSELAGLLGGGGSGGVQAKVDAFRRRATQSYLDAWKEPSAHLLDVQYTSKQPRPPSTGAHVDSAAILKTLSSKDRDAIKEKFKSFNAAFDDLLARHKAYRMEPEVRRQLARDVQMFIEPLYSRFWERYHEVDKGRAKYVKYDKAQLSQLLASLG